MEHRRPGSPARRLFRWLNFGLLLGHPRLLGLAAAGLRLYQTCGLQFLVRSSGRGTGDRSEEHTSELQPPAFHVCRLLPEKHTRADEELETDRKSTRLNSSY